MCGIFGIISRPGRFKENEVRRALDSISHRGPDADGLTRSLIGGKWEVWLGHRRLSILDLTPDGAQPMVRNNNSGRFKDSLVFNGEIYNHHELRNELSNRWSFQSRSDTEVLLAGLKLEGTGFVPKMNSMMAFAFLNEEEGNIVFGRDRIGKKPLYIYQSNDLLVFSSELKPIKDLDLNLEIDDEGLAFYRWLGYIPGEKTIYKGCSKLPAASCATLNLKGEFLPKLSPKSYWDPLSGYSKKYSYSYEQAIEEFHSLLDDATRIRSEADVPIGIFLSGGIDSSLVAASLKHQKIGDITAYTVSVSDADLDESSVAINTAHQLGLRLDVLNLSDQDFQRQVEYVAKSYDEPFSDSSQIPTLAIAEAASKFVKVVLTGDGGDEVFLGYPRFSQQALMMKRYELFKSIPFARLIVLALLDSRLGRSLIPSMLRVTGVGSAGANIDSKILRIKALLSLNDTAGIYETIMATNQRDWLPVESAGALQSETLSQMIRSWYPTYGWEGLQERSVEEQIAALDLVCYMKDDVLVKVDRATMAYGVEARSPLLDYRIVEFGTSLPLEYKLKGTNHKRLLRDALSQRLSGEVLKLGKKGFGVPLPANLPAARTAAGSWNYFVEDQWRKRFI